MVTRLLLLIAPLACFGASTMPPEADQRLAHDIYEEIVEIKSGFTTGATAPVVGAIAKRLRDAGFSDSDIFIGGAIPRKANLVVRYRGVGKLKPILLLAHTDVVEAKREDWSLDPFDWLLKDHRNLIDAEFCLNEGGRGQMVDRKRVSNDIQAGEKWYLDLRLEARNKGGQQLEARARQRDLPPRQRFGEAQPVRLPAQDQ